MTDFINESKQNTSMAFSSDAVQDNNKQNQSIPLPFGPIPEVPTQEAIDGIRFDFNYGLRVKVPKSDKSYRIRLVDLDNKCNLYDMITPKGQEGLILSKKRYFVNYRLLISQPEDDKLLFMHDYNAKGKEVVLRFPQPGLGDAIGWFSYMERFQQKHQCNLVCVVADWFSDIVKKQYPQIRFEQMQEGKIYENSYATYDIGIGNVGDFDFQPIDHRYVGLHRTVAHILDVSDEEIPPRFDLSAPRQIKEKYVCIGVQATTLAKMWNNPIGWETVVDYLLSKGYRVLCIDRERFTGLGGTYNRKPEKAENFTGNKPLQERINLLKDADFFIGLSSGLSWLAWGCHVPVVLISGFTNPINEFHTPYRVFNRNVCNSCWNDMTVKYDLGNYWSCPRLGDQNTRFECTAQITPEKVIETIDRLIMTSGYRHQSFFNQEA